MPSELTLRDYFAAMAMQGFLISNPNLRSEDVACEAYVQADAMLKERTRDAL
jgi:hypothetical protein